MGLVVAQEDSCCKIALSLMMALLSWALEYNGLIFADRPIP